MGTVIDDTTLATIEQEVAGDGVWIDPGFAAAHDLSAADEARIEQAVADTGSANLKVVLVEVDYADPRFTGSASDLSAWVHDDLGGSLTWLGYDRYAGSDGKGGVTLDTYGTQPSTDSIANVAAHDHPGDVLAQTLMAADLLDSGKAPQLWEAVPRDERYPWTADEEGGGGTAWLVSGIVVALLVLVVVARVLVSRSRRRRERGFVLPDVVLRTVKAAEDKALRERAEAEVLALGEAIAAAPDTSRHEGQVAVWRQALDHYAAARTVLDAAGSPADVVGALVLARRGEAARRVAQGKRKEPVWSPPVTCWFNPLHGTAGTRVTWQGEKRAVEVPACSACGASVQAGREPDDVLDFVAGHESEHYFNLDLGAWSATGYGALDPDLLGALRTARRSR